MRRMESVESMNIPILHEDENYLVINKPAGLAVHADGRSKEKTLSDWILKNRPALQGVGEPFKINPNESLKVDSSKTIERPGIVHRLDRETSGVMVIAKNQRSFADLKQKFKDREVRKIYHAVVQGTLKEDDGIIDRPIGRSGSDFRRRVAGRGARGELREAVTRWHVIKRGVLRGAPHDAQGKQPVTLVEAIPKTGRTHQIRAHFKAIQHPIIGDSLYNPNGLKNLPRVTLHSFAIEFSDLNGQKISATAPYPADFAGLVAEFS